MSSVIDRFSPVWDCLSRYLSDKLQKLQNRAARILTKSPFDTSSDHLLSSLDWERLFLRRKKQIRKPSWCLKAWMDLPRNIFRVFSLSVAQFITWGTLKENWPYPNQVPTIWNAASLTAGAMLWNNMPKSLKNAVSANHFKQLIKKVALADISDSHTAIM